MKPEAVALVCTIIFVGLVLAFNFGEDNKRSCELYPEFCFEWMRGRQ